MCILLYQLTHKTTVWVSIVIMNVTKFREEVIDLGREPRSDVKDSSDEHHSVSVQQHEHLVGTSFCRGMVSFSCLCSEGLQWLPTTCPLKVHLWNDIRMSGTVEKVWFLHTFCSQGSHNLGQVLTALWRLHDKWENSSTPLSANLACPYFFLNWSIVS